LEKIKV
jgi:hypothetical protein